MPRWLKQLINFIIVGGIATVIDFAILYLCYDHFHWHYLIASSLGFIVATLFNYVASMRYVFSGNAQQSKQAELILFISLSVAGLLLHQLLLYLMISYGQLPIYLAKLLVTICVTLFNFISRKLLLDRPKEKA